MSTNGNDNIETSIIVICGMLKCELLERKRERERERRKKERERE